MNFKEKSLIICTDNKIRKNKIPYETNLIDIQFIEYEKLPNKIKLNDFLKKVDKLEVKNDINIYVHLQPTAGVIKRVIKQPLRQPLKTFDFYIHVNLNVCIFDKTKTYLI